MTEMRVDPVDGTCRTCQGPLDIIDFDDCTLSVACAECGDTYDVETDAFGDGCMKYHFNLMAEKILQGEPDED